MDVIFKKGVKYTEEKIRELKAIFIEHKGIYMVLSSWFTAYKYHTYFNVVFLLIHFFLLLKAVYATTILSEDLEIASEAAYYSIVVFCAIFCLISLNLRKDNFRELLSKLQEGVYHYGDTLDPDTAQTIEEMRLQTRKRKIWLMNSVEILFNTFFAGCVVGLPIIAGKLSRKPELNEKYDNFMEGYSFLSQGPVIMWFPYDVKGWPGWIFANVSEYYIAVTILFVLDGMDIPFIGFSEECCLQIEILNLTLRKSLQRARYVFKKKYGEEVQSYNDRKFNACLEECLNDSIKHHHATNGFFKNIQEGYSPVVFFIIGTGSYMLCMAGLLFFSKRVHLGIKLAFLLYLTGGTAHIFIFSYYGEKITELSGINRDSAYEMEWMEVSKTMLPYIIMIQSSINTPLRLSAGGLLYCSFETFGDVVNSAYSYFNLLSAATDF